MPVARGPTRGHSELPSLLGHTFLNRQVLRACAVPEIEALKCIEQPDVHLNATQLKAMRRRSSHRMWPRTDPRRHSRTPARRNQRWQPIRLPPLPMPNDYKLYSSGWKTMRAGNFIPFVTSCACAAPSTGVRAVRWRLARITCAFLKFALQSRSLLYIFRTCLHR